MNAPLNAIRLIEFEGIGPGPLVARIVANMGMRAAKLTNWLIRLRRQHMAVSDLQISCRALRDKRFA